MKQEIKLKGVALLPFRKEEIFGKKFQNIYFK